MKNLLTKSSMISLLLAIGITSFAQVKSDYEKGTDFTKFTTYAFAGWQKDSDKQLNDFDKKRILDALKSEFDARGMNLVKEDADVQITLYLVLDKKSSTTAYTNFVGGMGYGPRWGWGMGAGMGGATTTYSENDYVEGTLVVDMYSTNTKKLVWQGILSKTVVENPKKREKTIPKNISKLMSKYPVAKVK